MDGSACSFDLMVAFTSASFVPSTWRFVIVPPKVVAAALQRSSRPTLPASWITQSAFVEARVGEPLADGLAGDRLALADVGEGAELGRALDAGVDGDDGDARGDGLLDAVLDAVGVGHRDDDAVDLLRPPRCRSAATACAGSGSDVVRDGGAVVVAGRLGARLHAVPEGVAGAGVGDDGEGEVAAAAVAPRVARSPGRFPRSRSSRSPAVAARPRPARSRFFIESPFDAELVAQDGPG